MVPDGFKITSGGQGISQGTTMEISLIIVGGAGRMGRRIIALAADDADFTISGVVEMPGHPDIGKDVGLIAGTGPAGIEIRQNYPDSADAVIDFSQPQAVEDTVNFCLEKKATLVIGTTGLNQQQEQKVHEASSEIPLIYGSNMSVGMNVLFLLAGRVASMLGKEYDIEIIEQHHRFKKDAPSGSALTLAKKICDSTQRDLNKDVVHGRKGKLGDRPAGQIGIHAVRAGDIAGMHSVMFSTLGETVTINHNAHSRNCFARGALLATKWLRGKKPGFYSMADCLGLKIQ